MTHMESILAEPPVAPGAGRRLRPQDARVLVAVTIALWTANFILLSARAYVDGEPISLAAMSARAAMSAIGCGICFILHLGLSRLRLASFRAKVLVAAAAALVAAEIFGWLNAGAAWLLFGRPLPAATGATVLVIGYYASTFFAWTALYLALAASAHASQVEQRASELRSLAQAAQLQALRYQLNPHFLFNTLNSLSALILDARVAEANEMVERLSRFLRSTLAADPLALVTLDVEIALQQLYLGIEQVRHPDLGLDVALPDALRSATVPALILQPIVENAVKHAIAGDPGPTRIRIAAMADDGRLRIEVSDEGPPQQHVAPGCGLGLQNVRQRLRSHYGDAAELDAARQPSGFRVTVAVPLELRG